MRGLRSGAGFIGRKGTPAAPGEQPARPPQSGSVDWLVTRHLPSFCLRIFRAEVAGGLVASVRPQAFPVTRRRLARQKKIRASRGSISIDPPDCPDACPVHRSEVRFGRPGRALSRPTWSPVKGQFRSRFPPSAQLRLSDNDFSGSPQPTPTSSQRNTSGRASWKRLGPFVTMRSRSLRRRVSECWL